MLKKTRPDGTYIKNLPYFTRMMPFLMPVRTDASIYFEQEFDVTRTLAYVREQQERLGSNQGNRLTFFHTFLCAAVRTIALRPKLNRFVSGLNYYQRNAIVFNFVAKKQLADEGEEINITIPFEPDETLESVSAKVNNYVNQGKGGEKNESDGLNALLVKLPRWLLRFIIRLLQTLDYHNLLPGTFIRSLPFWATVFFTNVGSVGIDAPFHHNFNIGTCSLFIALGRIQKVPVPVQDGGIDYRDKVKVTFTYDDRIVDGIYCARAIDLFRQFAENPEQLAQPLSLSEEQRAELMLKKPQVNRYV